MKELITRAQADLIFTAGPLAVALAAIAWWRLKRDPTGLAVGVASVLVGVMWRVFNAISDRMGIETLANLGVNAAVFFVVALGYGVWMRRVLPPIDDRSGRGMATENAAESAGDAGVGVAGLDGTEVDRVEAGAEAPVSRAPEGEVSA